MLKSARAETWGGTSPRVGTRRAGAGADGMGTESSAQEPAEASLWAGGLRGAAGALWPSVTSCEGILP